MTVVLPMVSARARGFSLLELLVGLTLGLLVSVAAVGTFSFIQNANRLNGEVSRMQQDAALAFNTIGQYLRSSGSVSLTQTGGGISFVGRGAFAGIPGSGDAVVRGVVRDGREVLQAAMSTLQDAGLNGPTIDCIGNEVPAVPTLLTEFDWNTANNELRCRRALVPGDTAGEMAPQPIIANVAQWVVHFGLRTADDRVQYRLRPAVADTDWPLVEALRICLVLTSQGPVDDFRQVFVGTNLPFNDCEPNDAAVIDRNTILNDPQRRMFRVYRHVFAIRPGAA